DLRANITTLGLSYVAGIMPNTTVWALGTGPLPPKKWSGRGRPPSRDPRSANMVARSPAPICSKPSAVPENDGLGPDNRNRAKDGGEPAIEPNKQKTISIFEVRLFRCPPAKHIDLLP